MTSRIRFLSSVLAVLTTICVTQLAVRGVAQWRAQIGNCGNARLDAGEQCDDGNTHDGDGCGPDCKIEKGWACRGTPSSCEFIACGNELIEPGETCDDGNRSDIDGCGSTCAVEKGWACAGEPSRCHMITCGDGIIDRGEACDDHNVRSSDGCDADCQVEKNWACTGVPSVCRRTTTAYRFYPSYTSGRTADAASSSSLAESLRFVLPRVLDHDGIMQLP